MFIVLTLLSLLALTAVLTYMEFMKVTDSAEELVVEDRLKRSASFLSGLALQIFSPQGIQRIKVFYLKWSDRDFSGWTKWFFHGLIMSSAFLILSGFFFALFIPRGLYGLSLLFHVMAGGVFAVCLSAVVVLRARHYPLEPGRPKKRAGRTLKTGILFWLGVASGLCLIVTALSSMLYFFPLTAQWGLIGVHRYGALVFLLSVIAFIYFSPDGKE